MNLTTTILPLANGQDAIAGQGQLELFTFSGAWATGDTFTLTFTDVGTGYQTQIGAGNAASEVPVFALTYGNQMNFVSGPNWFRSEVDIPTSFNNINSDQCGSIELGNQWGTPEDLAGIAPFQGKLALIARRTVQIWSVDPNLANCAIQQILSNIGTVSGASVQAVGDMDVYMAADNGIRSIRVRAATNNAYVEDVGTPIDNLLQPLLAALNDVQKATICSIVEPSSNRYWVFVPDSSNPNGVGLIYVFSQFPNSQIAAWSTYEPSYQAAISAPGGNYVASQLTYTGLVVGKRYAWTPGANEVSLTNGAQVFNASMTMKDGSARTQIPTSFIATATTAVIVGNAPTASFTGALSLTTYFTPQKFCVFNGQVFCRDTANNAYQYGGTTNLKYENCGASGLTPYHDSGKAATLKAYAAVDCAFQGTWAVGFSSDYATKVFKQVYSNNASSFQYGRCPVKTRGYFYALQFIENSNGYALFSSASVHFEEQEEK